MTNKTEKVIIHFLNKGYGDLTEYRTDEFPNSIFYVKDDKKYMGHNLKTGNFWVDYDNIWVDLKEWFSLEYKDIQSIIIKWLGETYNIKGVTPTTFSFQGSNVVNERISFSGATSTHMVLWD